MGRYYYDLDLSKALENKDDCIELIRDFYGYNGDIKTGGFYIMPDGTAVKSTNHADIDKLLMRYHYIPKSDIDYGDGSQFMDTIGCLRLRRRGGKDSWILPYVLLPEQKLTQVQYDILTKWLDFVLQASGEVSIQAQRSGAEVSKVFKRSQGIWTDDIIDSIKTYYRTNILEGTEYDNVFDDEIDQTDYQLKYDTKKGFFNQF